MSVVNRLKQYMENNGYNKADIARLSSIPYTTIDGLFKKGDENIKLSTLKKLARLIGCTLDDLAFSEDELERNADKFSPKEISTIKKYRQLDADGKEDVDDYINMKLLQAQRRAEEKEEGLA